MSDGAAREAAGLFGPGSVSWRVDRELIVLAGGSCALLMQAAHPSVAAGVAQHSDYATEVGFAGVLAGPLVRSSYRAGRLWARATVARGGSVPEHLSHLLDAAPGRQAV